MKLALPHTTYTGVNCFPLSFLINSNELAADLDGIWWFLMPAQISRPRLITADHQKNNKSIISMSHSYSNYLTVTVSLRYKFR